MLKMEDALNDSEMNWQGFAILILNRKSFGGLRNVSDILTLKSVLLVPCSVSCVLPRCLPIAFEPVNFALHVNVIIILVTRSSPVLRYQTLCRLLEFGCYGVWSSAILAPGLAVVLEMEDPPLIEC